MYKPEYFIFILEEQDEGSEHEGFWKWKAYTNTQLHLI